MSQPVIMECPSFTVSGITTRTKNVDEMHPLSAKIAPLWGRFFQEGIAQKISSATHASTQPVAYGVYSNYESDYMGLFNVTAGVEGKHVDFESIDIPEGTYLVFERSGVLPMAVIEAWKDVWNYFNSASAYRRTYIVDVEKYLAADTVALYIGVEKVSGE